MQFVYGSDTGLQPLWLVEAVEAAAPLKGAADCARVSIRRQPAVAPSEVRLCVEAGSGSVRYETGAESQTTVGSLNVQVVDTVVTTLDASGAPVRRLRELYAVSLTTALGGTFEVPDPAAPGGWRTQQVFELKEVRLPQ